MKTVQVDDKTLVKHSMTVSYVNIRHDYLMVKDRNFATLYDLVDAKVLSETMAKKVAGTGLNLSHLKLAYRRNELSGIRNLFTEKFDKKARVTAQKRIIDNVNVHLAKLIEGE